MTPKNKTFMDQKPLSLEKGISSIEQKSSSMERGSMEKSTEHREVQVYGVINTSLGVGRLLKHNTDEFIILDADGVIKTTKEIKQIPYLHSIYKNMDFTDVVFIIEDKQLKAHKCILASRSDYFKCMFSSSMKEKDGVVTIKQMSYDVFCLIIKFCYIDTITLTWENYYDLVKGADQFLINDLKWLCEMEFENIFTPEKFCIKLHKLKLLENIRPKIVNYIKNNWSFMIKKDELYCALESDKEFQKELFAVLEIKSKRTKVSKSISMDIKDMLNYLETKSSKIAEIQLLTDIPKIKLFCKENSILVPSWFENKYRKL